MAAPDTLSTAAIGMFVRDSFYGVTGLPLPNAGAASTWKWQDRARTLEDGWTKSDKGLAGSWGSQDFLDGAVQPRPTGHLVLNSTSVSDSCRVWISQLDVRALPVEGQLQSYDPEKTCDKQPSEGARTIDLFGAYGPDNKYSDCMKYISAATAALMSARFPYVTPSGVVSECPGGANPSKDLTYWPQTQLVDGGYVDNTG